SASPRRYVEDGVGLVVIVLVLRTLGSKAFGIVDEVRRGNAGTSVDVLLDRVLVDQQRQRLAHCRIRQDRMLGLDARALAVDLGPGVGHVELDVLDAATSVEDHAALAALLEAREDLVADLHVPPA